MELALPRRLTTHPGRAPIPSLICRCPGMDSLHFIIGNDPESTSTSFQGSKKVGVLICSSGSDHFARGENHIEGAVVVARETVRGRKIAQASTQHKSGSSDVPIQKIQFSTEFLWKLGQWRTLPGHRQERLLVPEGRHKLPSTVRPVLL